MNCIEAQDLLQRRLDGAPIDDTAALAQHLIGCADCRTLHAAAGRLEHGLRVMRPAVPPPALRVSIVTGVLADQGARRRRRVLIGMALAASVLLAVSVGISSYDSNQSL